MTGDSGTIVAGQDVAGRPLLPRGRVTVNVGWGSGEGGDVSVGGDDVCGGGPAVEDADDVASGG